MWSMSRVSTGSHWTVLLPGFLLAGVGIGFVNAPLATTAVSTMRVERAGMASGINNTFRQVGVATGIAGLGAIFGSVAGSNGTTGGGSSAAARTAFVHGFHDILLVGAGASLAGAVLAVALVRRQDFIASRPA
jgi:hypothetical protein